MSEEISWLSAVIAISSGLIGVGVTSIVNYIIANKNRKIQSELSIKEMELKEKIEYHKLGIDHLMNKIKQLNNYDFNRFEINDISAEFFIAKNNGNHVEMCKQLYRLYDFFCKFHESEYQLSLYVSSASLEKLIHLHEEYEIYIKQNQDFYNYFQNKSIDDINDDFVIKIDKHFDFVLRILFDLQTVISLEIREYIDQIDRIVKKFLE